MAITRTSDFGTAFPTAFSAAAISATDLTKLIMSGIEYDKRGAPVAIEYKDRTSNSEYPATLKIRRTQREYLALTITFGFYTKVVDDVAGTTEYVHEEVILVFRTEDKIFKDGTELTTAALNCIRMMYHHNGTSWVFTCNPLLRANFDALEGSFESPVTSAWTDLV